MDQVDNVDPEEFFLFIQNFQMTTEAPGTLLANAKVQYLLTLLHGDELRQLEKLTVELGC